MKLTKIFSSLLLVAVVVCFTACEKNNELKKNNKTGNGTISGTMGDVVGCWAQVGNYTEYYEIDADGYITCYTNNSKSWEYQEFVYTGEQYVKKSSMVLEWEKDFTAPYQYSKNKLTVYYFLTPTYELEWHSGSEVSVAGSIGECIRIDPNIYFTKHFNSVKTIEDDWKKDSLECAEAHKTQFSVGKPSSSPKHYGWVLFAPGNLQCKPATREWRFASHQYDTIGENNNCNRSLTNKAWISLFCWSTDDSHYGITESTDIKDFQGIFVDWGNNMGDGWYTPTSDEMEYIWGYRPNAELLRGRACVNGINGHILLPDFFVMPQGISFINIPTYGNVSGHGYSDNVYTLGQWRELESLGAVFLPAENGTNSHTEYWTSTSYDYYYSGVFYGGGVMSGVKYYAFAVRLIKSAKDYETMNFNSGNTDDNGGTEENKETILTCAEALTHLNENVTVEGYVAFAYTASSTTTQSAWIADDSQTNVGVLEAYNCNITSQVVKGDKVRVEGKMAKFTKTNGEVIYEINGGKMTKL